MWTLQEKAQCAWRVSLRRDQTSMIGVIFDQNVKGHYQADHRYVGAMRRSRRLEVSFGREDPDVRTKHEDSQNPILTLPET